MKIRHAFKSGLCDVLRNKEIWLLFFSVQFVFALILVQPVRNGLTELIGRSISGGQILSGEGANILFEYMVHKQDAVSALSSLFLLTGTVYILIMIFLKAGAAGMFVNRQKFSAGAFFGAAGAYFWRFFRLFLFSLVFFGISVLIYIMMNAVLIPLAGYSEPLRVMFSAAGLLILAFLFFLVRMVFDYAKLMTVQSESNKMCRTAFSAWKFVFRHPGAALGLFYLAGTLGVLLWAVYYFPGSLIPAAGAGILLMFVWQQLFAFSRTGIVLLHLAAQASLLKELAPPVSPACPEPDSGTIAAEASSLG